MEEPIKFHSQEHIAIMRLVVSERSNWNPMMHKHYVII
jgi:hypothetical protein